MKATLRTHRAGSLLSAVTAGCAALAFAIPAAAGPATYPAAVLANNPYVYYRQNETAGTTAADTSGNGRAGVYNGAPALSVAGVGAGTDGAASL